MWSIVVLLDLKNSACLARLVVVRSQPAVAMVRLLNVSPCVVAQLLVEVCMQLALLDELLEQACNLHVFVAPVTALFLARLYPVWVATLGADRSASLDRRAHVRRQAQKVPDGFREGLITRALPSEECLEQLLCDAGLSLRAVVAPRLQ